MQMSLFLKEFEEINSKTPNYAAIKNGYNKAFVTILDANITTLLTAFILSFLGSNLLLVCDHFKCWNFMFNVYSYFLQKQFF